MAPYTLHKSTWKTKTAARKAIQSIKNTATLGVPLCSPNTLIVYDLLTRHPDYRKIDEYRFATSITVQVNPAYGTTCFYVHSTNNEPLAFSIRACFQPPTPRVKVMSACRHLIFDQTASVKRRSTDSNGMIKCEISGDLVPVADIDVDHNYDDPNTMFASLVDSFMTSLRITPNVMAIKKIPRTNIVKFQSEALNKSWPVYHAKNANLRCIKRSLNQRRVPQ